MGECDIDKLIQKGVYTELRGGRKLQIEPGAASVLEVITVFVCVSVTLSVFPVARHPPQTVLGSACK